MKSEFKQWEDYMIFIPQFDPNSDAPLSITTYVMRTAVGILALALPTIIFIWSFFIGPCHGILESISIYYQTDIRDLFVGILCAVAFFMLCYHGYSMLDFITFKLTGLSALGIAFFPAYLAPGSYICQNPMTQQSDIVNILHFSCAGLFFLLLTFISIVLFRKTFKGVKTTDIPAEKKRRNIVYLVCGIIILICGLLCIIIALLPPNSPILSLNPGYWLETIALFSFGVSWLLKGRLWYHKRKKLVAKNAST